MILKIQHAKFWSMSLAKSKKKCLNFWQWQENVKQHIGFILLGRCKFVAAISSDHRLHSHNMIFAVDPHFIGKFHTQSSGFALFFFVGCAWFPFILDNLHIYSTHGSW